MREPANGDLSTILNATALRTKSATTQGDAAVVQVQRFQLSGRS